MDTAEMPGVEIELDGKWIAPFDASEPGSRQRPVHQLAGGITLPRPTVRAVLTATAHGVYEAFLNGVRVGSEELTPGFTSYHSNLQVQRFEVGHLLVVGENVLGALLSDGWWRGQIGGMRHIDVYGTTTALMMQLEIEDDQGAVTRFVTGPEWRSTPSHILGADLIAGERHDLRRRADWNEWHAWSPVEIEDHDMGRLVVSASPPVRRITELAPVEVREIGPRRWVVDFGQNINGWVRLRHLGAEGNVTTLTFGEWLDADGDVTQENLSIPGFVREDAGIPFQVDEVTSAGLADDVFEPRHSTKGFQFVRVEGLDILRAEDIRAVVVHTDLQRVGAFACSSARVDRLHEISEWSFLGNACDIPTDCPTRERSGWVGDWQLFVETASFLFDVDGFSRKWLRDLAADQNSEGMVPSIVPAQPAILEPFGDTNGSSGWGDAAVHVPWILYRTSADPEVLGEQWESARRWVDWAAAQAADGRNERRREANEIPEDHEQYLWDTGWHWGEWLEVGENTLANLMEGRAADRSVVASAYLFRSSQELAEIARILGHEDDAARYAELSDRVADAWRREFLSPDGSLTPDTQATYARAIAFGLVPPELRPAAADRLVELIREADTHLSTGFLATPFLLPVLADTGHIDVAYELLLQDTEPSWMVMVDRGGSTVWEKWNGVNSDGTPDLSLNHYSKGAVISFLHQYVAGIKLIEPGYRRFAVRPFPGGGITSASAHHDSPFGRISVAWSLDDSTGRGQIDITVPAGTQAQLTLPDGTEASLDEGVHQRTWQS